MIVLKVYRFNPDIDEDGYYKIYQVPFTKGMRVLDALHYIHDHLDGSLAYRWICRAGQCGSCSILVNGKAVLACQEEIKESGEAITLEPLSLFPVIKDLVVDTGEGYEKMRSCEPYLKRECAYSGPDELEADDIKDVKKFRECIECFCCVNACPVVNQVWDDYFGPMVMRKLCELKMDKRDVGKRIDAALNEGLYHCTTCRNCWAVCPQEIEIPEKAIENMRAWAVEEGKGPLDSHNSLVQSIKNYKNPWIMPRSKRAKWAKRLDIPSKGEVMFYAGCSPSLLFGERVPAKIIAVLRRIGIEPAYLGRDERCCGSPLLKVGDRKAYDEIVSANIEQMKAAGVKTIVTTCAGCHKSWAVDYKEFFGDFGIDVKHITEIVLEAYEKGLIKFNDIEKNHVRVTYHDPCHLGRGSGIYDAPRKLIKAMPGMELIEPERNRENSHCCGSGGGVKTGKPDVALKVGEERVRMFDALDVEYVITCCPWCEQHIDDSIAASDSPLYKTRDLIEIIEETMEHDIDGENIKGRIAKKSL